MNNLPKQINEWETPVYRVQCLSVRIARWVCGTGNVSRHSNLEADIFNPRKSVNPMFTFRAKPQYRSPAAISMRNRVAKALKTARGNKR